MGHFGEHLADEGLLLIFGANYEMFANCNEVAIIVATESYPISSVNPSSHHIPSSDQAWALGAEGYLISEHMDAEDHELLRIIDIPGPRSRSMSNTVVDGWREERETLLKLGLAGGLGWVDTEL